MTQRHLDLAPQLALFFSKRVSLATWDRMGILDRETALYRKLQELGVRVTFVTYGTGSDLEYRDRLPGIEICSNRWRLPLPLYMRSIPWLHRGALVECGVFKTNQVPAGAAARAAAARWGKPLIARCGYLPSVVAEQEHGAGSFAHRKSLRSERRLFGAAARVVVSTEDMRRRIARDIPVAGDRVRVIPNYVDTDRFCPVDVRPPEFDLVFVGRLSSEKNLDVLLEAIRPLQTSLLVIGGENPASWRERYREFGRRVEWAGVVPHGRLPEQIRRARVFVLPSRYEGHPKALLEAMACGLPAIGADVPGIRDAIDHGHTGYLSPADPRSLRTAVQMLLDHETLRDRLAKAGRSYVVQNFSLPRIAEMEMDLIREMVYGQNQRRAG